MTVPIIVISCALLFELHQINIKYTSNKHNITPYNCTKGCKCTSELNCHGGVAPLWTHSTHAQRTKISQRHLQ